MGSNYNNDNPFWYAMSATFGRAIKAKEALDAANVRNYVPCEWRVVVKKDGTKDRKYLPVVANLIFLYVSWNELMSIKAQMPWLQIQTFPTGGRNVPIIVREDLMANFIKAVDNPDDAENAKIIYLKPEEVDLEQGTLVRVLGGPLDNVVGKLIKKRGPGNKNLIVEIEGIIAAKVELKTFDLIERL